MGPATKATAERLAAAIRKAATEARHHRLAERAERGEFGDYANPPPGAKWICPITELHRLCRQFGLHALADRVAAGEFDASIEESDEWARSPDGQRAASGLSPELRNLLNIPVIN